MDIINSLKWRYATKKFDATKIISNEKLNIIKEAFNLTATSFGLQTINMVIVSDKEVRNSLVEHSYNQLQVKEASHLLVICIQDNITDEDVDKHFDNVSNIRNTPEHILAPFRSDLKNMMQRMTEHERQQ